MTSQVRPLRLEHQRLMHDELIDNFIIPTCINCESWDYDKDHCGKYQQKPPAQIIVKACPEWVPEIPF